MIRPLGEIRPLKRPLKRRLVDRGALSAWGEGGWAVSMEMRPLKHPFDVLHVVSVGAVGEVTTEGSRRGRRLNNGGARAYERVGRGRARGSFATRH